MICNAVYDVALRQQANLIRELKVPTTPTKSFRETQHFPIGIIAANR